MIKYMYNWMDWGLFDVEEVEVLQEDYEWYKYPQEKFSLVKFKNRPGFTKPFPCQKKHLFNTYEEAYAFGLKDCPTGAF